MRNVIFDEVLPVARCCFVAFAVSVWCWPACLGAQEEAPVSPAEHPLQYINNSFENASPLYWEVGEDGEVNIYLVYDQERSSPNRANGHWHFQLQARRGTELTLILHHFQNVWNGKQASPLRDGLVAWVSHDGRTWKPQQTKALEGYRLQIDVKMESDSMYVARLEPYRLSDLERLKASLADNPLVEFTQIGKTVEGRPLEIMRIGDAAAPHRVLLRARAHPWEPGGNWVLEGAVRRLLANDEQARKFRSSYCLYLLPMANKDGVARGRTRFNMQGCDLNRNWDRPADPRLAPENYALEQWLDEMKRQGRLPQLAIDFHNDNSGRLHVSRPEAEFEAYLANMQRFEALLRKHTWFTEGATGGSFRNPGTMGEGLLVRYRIDACIHELNANWIAGLDDYASAKNWMLYGAQLCDVFYAYFEAEGT